MRKLRVGLVGCGAFGESYLSTFRGIPHAEVLGIADLVTERAEALASKYRIPAFEVNALLSNREIDAVAVVTTEGQHLEPTLSALDHGKHVMLEKPMATRLGEAESMVRRAQEKNLILMPGHLLRFEPRYAQVKEAIQRGELGRILHLSMRRNRTRALGRIYKRTPLVLEVALHDIDLMLWYTGEPVYRVRAWQTEIEAGTGADVFSGVITFRNGTLGMFHTSWLLPEQTPLLDDHMQILGSVGVANVDILNSGLCLWTNQGVTGPDTSYEPRFHGVTRGALREQLLYFTECCLEGRPPRIVTARDGLESVRVSLALIKSAEQGREIEL